MGKFIDLTGQRFGKLIVVERVKTPNHIKYKGNTYWKCACDCGNEKIIQGRSIRIGHSTSCGCLDLQNKKSKENINRLKKIGFNNRKGVVSIYNEIYWHTYHNAKTRNLSFNIDKNFCYEICSKNCFYCNGKDKRKNKNTGEIFDCVGLDRFDNNEGYNKNNIVPCCGTCNRAKNVMTKKEFLSWIERVYKHSVENKKTKESI